MDVRGCFLSVCYLILTLYQVQADAADPQVHEEVRLVTGDSYFPFISPALPYGGWSNAIVKSVFKEMGIMPAIDVMPWSRGAKWTRENRYLGTFPYVHSEGREEDFLFSQPINHVPIRIFTSKNNGITERKHLHKKRLCLPHGFLVSQTIERLKNQYELVINRAKDTAACFGHVDKGWSDLGLINGYTSIAHITDVFEQPDAFLVLPKPVNTVPLYFIVSRTYPDGEKWMQSFNTALNRIKEKGELSALNRQFTLLLRDSYIVKRPVNDSE